MRLVFQKPHTYWLLGIFLAYAVISLLISGFYNTIPAIIANASTVNWPKLSLSLLFSLTIGALVAINSVYLFILYRARLQCRSATTLTSVGATAGLITGVCPLCVTGLIPLLFGLFGVSFSLGSLPFQGLEVQVLTVLLLSLSLYFIAKKEKGK